MKYEDLLAVLDVPAADHEAIIDWVNAADWDGLTTMTGQPEWTEALQRAWVLNQLENICDKLGEDHMSIQAAIRVVLAAISAFSEGAMAEYNQPFLHRMLMDVMRKMFEDGGDGLMDVLSKIRR